MNAHHKQRINRESFPTSIHYISSGITRQESFNRIISRVPLGWQLDLILPQIDASSSSTASTVAQDITALVAELSEYYYCPAVNLADLLQVEFMNSFIRKGSLLALNIDTETGETICIDGRGRMVLSAPKDTHELLGLPGRPSRFGSLGQQFIIEINLLDSAFRAGKKGFERIKSRLREWPKGTDLFEQLNGISTTNEKTGRRFEMIMCWIDEAGNPGPITFPSGVISHRRSPSLSTTSIPSPLVPNITTLNINPPSSTSNKRRKLNPPPNTNRLIFDDSKEEFEQMAALREWVGLTSIGAKVEDNGDLPMVKGGRTETLSWNGLFHSSVLIKVVERLSYGRQLEHLPFCSISLRPHPAAPISHLSTVSPQVVGTRQTPSGKKVKRGRGRGEEEEEEGEQGWEIILRRGENADIEFVSWEMQ